MGDEAGELRLGRLGREAAAMPARLRPCAMMASAPAASASRASARLVALQIHRMPRALSSAAKSASHSP
jgi:hypothetical protein